MKLACVRPIPFQEAISMPIDDRDSFCVRDGDMVGLDPDQSPIFFMCIIHCKISPPLPTLV